MLFLVSDKMKTAVMSSHQRPKTYGKSSRRIISDSSYLAVHDSARHVNESSRGDGQREARGADSTIEADFLQSKPVTATRQPTKSDLPYHPGSSFRGSRVIRPYQKPDYPSRKQASASPKKDLMLGNMDDNVFDVPSSGEDDGGRLCSGNDLLKRKRRKLLAEVVKKETNLVYDDESLQRHIAAEASKIPQTIYNISTDQNDSKSNAATRPKAVKSRQSKREGLLNGSSQARLTRIEKANSKKTTQPHVLRPDRKPDPSLSANCEGGSPVITAITSDAPITPRRLATAKRATTPRQLELWNLLLKDETPKSDSTPVKSASSDIYEDTKNLPKSISLSEGGFLRKPISEVPRRRRRLVDNLNRRDDEICGILGRSEDEFDSSFSIRPENKETTSRLDPISIHVQRQPSTDHTPILPDHQPALLHQGGGLKVTYARQRSYLTEDDLSQATISDFPITDDLVSVARKRYRGTGEMMPRLQIAENFDEGLDEVTNSQASAMRSIHELREAGGNARVFSEMDAMLDDIDEARAVSLTHRRSRLLDLAVKLQEVSFCRLFIDQGLELRIFPHLESANDLFIDALLATILLRLLASSTSVSKLSHINDSRVKDFLIGLLDKDQNLKISTQNRKFNISKTAQAEFKDLWDSLLKSAAWRAGKPTILTPCVMCLQCLEYVVRNARDVGSVDTLLSGQDIRSIVKVLRPDPSDSPGQPSDPWSAVKMNLSISILESCTISNAVPCEETPWTGHTLDLAVGLLPLLDTRLEEDVGTLRTLTLRLYLNLTNNNPTLCRAFSRPDVIGSMLNIIVSHFQRLSENATPHKPEVMLDNLILSLGSMINLAEWCDTVRPLVLSLRLGDACFLDILLQLFMSKQMKLAEVRYGFPTMVSYSNLARSSPKKRSALTWLLATYQFFSVTCVSME